MIATEKSEKYEFVSTGDAKLDSEPVVKDGSVRIQQDRIKARTTEESLHLDTIDPSVVIVTEHQSADIDDTLPIEEQLQFTIGLPRIIEPNTFADVVPNAGFEFESPTANGGSVRRVANRFWLDGANFLIGSKLGVGVWGKVGVELSVTLSTPHEARREARCGPAAARAADSSLSVVTSI